LTASSRFVAIPPSITNTYSSIATILYDKWPLPDRASERSLMPRILEHLKVIGERFDA